MQLVDKKEGRSDERLRCTSGGARAQDRKSSMASSAMVARERGYPSEVDKDEEGSPT